jgi:hypothetical protein
VAFVAKRGGGRRARLDDKWPDPHRAAVDVADHRWP